MSLRPLKWENDALTMLDQRKIPLQTEYLHLTSSADVAAAIEMMRIG